MEMLVQGAFRPLKLEGGTFVFAKPIGKGYVPMIALEDLAFYVDWILTHPERSAGIDLAVATEDVTWDSLVKTFIEVTGLKAVNPDIGEDEYFVLYRVSRLANGSLIIILRPKLLLKILILCLLLTISKAGGHFGEMALLREIINCST